jgi:hypothetical protein
MSKTRSPELTAVTAASPPRHAKTETNPDSGTFWSILKISPWAKPTDPVIVTSCMIFGYPAKANEGNRTFRWKQYFAEFQFYFRQYDHQERCSVSSSHCHWNILFRKFLHAICLTLVALIQCQCLCLVEDEVLHWDVTASTHVLCTSSIGSDFQILEKQIKKYETRRRTSRQWQWSQRALR